MSKRRKIGNADTAALVRLLTRNGWAEVDTKNHVKLRHPIMGVLIFARTTSDNARSNKNHVALVRRTYRAHDLPCPIERNHRA